MSKGLGQLEDEQILDSEEHTVGMMVVTYECSADVLHYFNKGVGILIRKRLEKGDIF